MWYPLRPSRARALFSICKGRNCNWCQNGGIELDTSYSICRIEEWEGGEVVIGTECTSNLYPGADNRTVLYNQLLRFDYLAYPTTDRQGELIEVLTLASTSDADVHEMPPTLYNGGVLIVSKFNVPCPFSIGAQFRLVIQVHVHPPTPLHPHLEKNSNVP